MRLRSGDSRLRSAKKSCIKMYNLLKNENHKKSRKKIKSEIFDIKKTNTTKQLIEIEKLSLVQVQNFDEELLINSCNTTETTTINLKSGNCEEASDDSVDCQQKSVVPVVSFASFHHNKQQQQQKSESIIFSSKSNCILNTSNYENIASQNTTDPRPSSSVQCSNQVAEYSGKL